MRRNRYYRKWLSGDRGTLVLIALLVLAFPVGLWLMWREAKWKIWLKALITAAWTGIIVLGIVVFTTTSFDYDQGSIIVTELVNDKRMLAPLPPEDLPDTSQLLKSASETSSLISLPTPTPVATRVYCNDNGKYYHLAGCRYVYPHTPKVTLNQAKNAGKTACPICKPPKEEIYGQE